jgi:hypothetical protein
VRRGIVSLLLLASLASMPVSAAAAASCGIAAAAPCCCGDESSCPCASSQGETPAKHPATPASTAAPEILAPIADALAAPATDPAVGATEARSEVTPPAAAGSSRFLANCSFRC